MGRRRTSFSASRSSPCPPCSSPSLPNVGWLFAARALQGIGTGFAIGAASAKLVEYNVSPNPRFASSLTTASTATGLTLALLLSGVLAQLAPLPLVLSFVLLFALAVVAFVFIALTPDDREAARTDRWRPQPIRVARGTVLPFVVATLSVSVAYTVGALFLSLGASMARQLTHTTNLIVVGATLALSSLVIGVTALLIQRIHAQLAVVVGGVVSIGGLAAMAATAASGSLWLLLLWAVVGGAGYSLSFTGRARAAESNGAARTPRSDPVAALPVRLPHAGRRRDRCGRPRDGDRARTGHRGHRAHRGVLCVAAIVFAIVDVAGRRSIAEATA